MAEFRPYGKTPRLNRDIIITEKIDGTNAGIHVELVADYIEGDAVFRTEAGNFRIFAQSRNRLVHVGADNAGFAAWVLANGQVLVETLGEGLHFGEWYGKGIQGGHGLDHKRLALFNPDRYDQERLSTARANGVAIETVPVLYRGLFNHDEIEWWVAELKQYGSQAVKGHKAEGVIVFHTASRQVYKVLCESDELPKSMVA